MRWSLAPVRGILVLLIPAAIFAALLWASKWALLENRRAEGPAAKVVQVTDSQALDRYPAFSPDGASIAFSSNRRGTFEIFTQSLPGGPPQQITADGLQNVEPTWSPDGASIAYTSQSRKGIFVIPASGGTPQKLTDFGAEPTWSPDNRLIAFRSETTIWVVSVQGGAPRAVTQANHPQGAHSSPRWHPDGMSILFMARNAANSSAWLVRVREGGVTEVLADPGENLAVTYSPDANSVLFARLTGGQFMIQRRVFRGMRTFDLLPLGQTAPMDISFDNIGRRAAYVLGDAPGKGNIYVSELPR